jgi:hypothetical protein
MKAVIEATKDFAAIVACSVCAMGLLWLAAVATGIWQ